MVFHSFTNIANSCVEVVLRQLHFYTLHLCKHDIFMLSHHDYLNLSKSLMQTWHWSSFWATWSSGSLSRGETSYPLSSSFLLYMSIRRLLLVQRKKMHTQNNVQSLVKLDLKFVNARSFFVAITLWTEDFWKISFEIVVMLCYLVYIKMMSNQYLYSLLPNWWGRGDRWKIRGRGYNSWGL